MRRVTPSAQHDAALRKLRRRKFSKVRVAGADALVAFSRQDAQPVETFRDMADRTGYQRWYPSESGFVVKWPYQGQAYDPEVFRVEPGGWDHEHCSVCNASIEIDEVCWITQRGSFYLLCRACHRRLARLARC